MSTSPDLVLLIVNTARLQLVDELPVQDDCVPATSKALPRPMSVSVRVVSMWWNEDKDAGVSMPGKTYSSMTTFMFLALNRMSSFVRFSKMFSLSRSCDFNAA